jgi:hypothetical protein
MSLHSLRQILPPPDAPWEAVAPARWPSVERFLCTELPTDYKQFLEVYGTGHIDGYLRVSNPLRRSTYPWIQETLGALGHLHEMRAGFGREQVPDSLFPELGGLLPWASTTSGDSLYWRTRGTPDRWTVVVLPARATGGDDFDGPAIAFLEAVLRRQYRSHVMGEFPESPVFIPDSVNQ